MSRYAAPSNALRKEKTFMSPFTPSYWKAAALEVTSIRTLAVMAMLLAATIVVRAYLWIPLGWVPNLRLKFDFLPEALAGAVGGPILGVIFGALSDIISFLINPTGAYFPGYTLSCVLVMLTFSLFFYKRKISMWRIALAKLIYNGLINILLGSLWSSMMLGKAYVVYFWSSLIKNSIMYPIETVMLFVLFGALIIPMVKLGLIPEQKTIFLPAVKKLFRKGDPFLEESPADSAASVSEKTGADKGGF